MRLDIDGSSSKRISDRFKIWRWFICSKNLVSIPLKDLAPHRLSSSSFDRDSKGGSFFRLLQFLSKSWRRLPWVERDGKHSIFVSERSSFWRRVMCSKEWSFITTKALQPERLRTSSFWRASRRGNSCRFSLFCSKSWRGLLLNISIDIPCWIC